MKGLQDDYERTGVKDSEHEEDMRALGGMVFSGQFFNLHFKLYDIQNFHLISWIRNREFVLVDPL